MCVRGKDGGGVRGGVRVWKGRWRCAWRCACVEREVAVCVRGKDGGGVRGGVRAWKGRWRCACVGACVRVSDVRWRGRVGSALARPQFPTGETEQSSKTANRAHQKKVIAIIVFLIAVPLGQVVH